MKKKLLLLLIAGRLRSRNWIGVSESEFVGKIEHLSTSAQVCTHTSHFNSSRSFSNDDGNEKKNVTFYNVGE